MTAVAGILFPAVATKAGAANIPEWFESNKVFQDGATAYPFGEEVFSFLLACTREKEREGERNCFLFFFQRFLAHHLTFAFLSFFPPFFPPFFFPPTLQKKHVTASNLAVTLLLSGWAETKRLMDYRNPGSQGDGSFFNITDDFKGNGNGYPGGKLFDPIGFSRGDEAKLAEYKVKEVKNGRLAMVALVGFVAQYKATGKGPIDNLVDHIATGASFATNGVSLPLYHP